MIGFRRQRKNPKGNFNRYHYADNFERNARAASQCNCNHIWQQFEKRCPSCGRKR